MFENRRKHERLDLRGTAKILNGPGGLPRDCTVTDVSDGGVRLFAEAVEIPEDFTLLFAGKGGRRQCQVVWRLGFEVGAEFVDSSEDDFARKLLRTELARSYANQQRLYPPDEDPIPADAVPSKA